MPFQLEFSKWPIVPSVAYRPIAGAHAGEGSPGDGTVPETAGVPGTLQRQCIRTARQTLYWAEIDFHKRILFGDADMAALWC